MIDTTINLLVNWTEYTNLFGTTLMLRLAVKSDNSSPAIIFRDSEKLDATIKLSLILPTAEALRLDKDNGNMLWHDAVKTELDQIRDYDTFRDMGIGVTMDSNHHKINVRLVFDVKASGK